MASTVEIVPWLWATKLKDGELNPLPRQFTEVVQSQGVPLQSMLDLLMKAKFDHNVSNGSGPYVAVVLETYTGPYAKIASSYDRKIGIKHYGEEYPPGIHSIDDAGSKKQSDKLWIRAKIPELTPGTSWPKNVKDIRGIAQYPLFNAQETFKDNPALSSIKAGSAVLVDFLDKTNKEKGFVISAIQTGMLTQIREIASSTAPFRALCALPKICMPEDSDLYVGHTVSDMYTTGPPVKKIKGKIKTGVYGDGTEQTKYHFVESLKHSLPSLSGLAGPPPGPKNAFIWVGHTLANGSGDIIDRPNTTSRETIIYAPSTLDVTSPIEIKYYFHDHGGFGYPWLAGPKTTVEESISFATQEGNDFREKIAPAIKELIKDNRNIILVIPEMRHSRGFGTKMGNKARVEKMIKNEDTDVGEVGHEQGKKIVRFNRYDQTNFPILSTIKKYVKSVFSQVPYTIESGGTTFFRQPWLKIPEFDDEIRSIIREYLGQDINITYTSYFFEGRSVRDLAVGLFDSTSANELKNHLAGLSIDNKMVRIDFMPNEYSRVSRNVGFNTTKDEISLPESPANGLLVASKLVERLSEAGSENIVLEFNYLSQFTDDPILGGLNFFAEFGKEQQFKNAYKQSSSDGEQKFDFWMGENPSQKKYISYHVVGEKKTAYAFSMINNKHKIADSPTPSRPASILSSGASNIPDHAMSISYKAGDAKIVEYQKILVNIESHSSNITNLIQLLISGENPCSDHTYVVYCSNEAGLGKSLSHKKGSIFAKEYEKYIKNLIEKSKIETLLIHEGIFKDNNIEEEKSPDTLGTYKHSFEQEKQSIEEGVLGMSISEAKDYVKQLSVFAKLLTEQGSVSQSGIITLESAAFVVGSYEAYEVTIERVKQLQTSANNNLVFAEKCKLPEECIAVIHSLGDLKNLSMLPQMRPGSRALDRMYIKCTKGNNDKVDAEIPRIPLFDNYNDIASRMFSPGSDFFPKKEDFTGWEGTRSNTTLNLENYGHETSTFMYMARKGQNIPQLKKSPKVWACLTDRLAMAWNTACVKSNYYPILITDGVAGSHEESGPTAYKTGLAPGALGLSINVDGVLAGHTQGKLNHGIFTGAWTPGIGDNPRLYELGVYNNDEDENMDNIYGSFAGLTPMRIKINDIESARDVYLLENEKHQKIINELDKHQTILGPSLDANPTHWLIVFCSMSGMKWGNSHFLRKRQRGGATWTEQEQLEISKIFKLDTYNINVVKAIEAISWNNKNTSNDVHMHFQWYNGGNVITWEDIEKAKG